MIEQNDLCDDRQYSIVGSAEIQKNKKQLSRRTVKQTQTPLSILQTQEHTMKYINIISRLFNFPDIGLLLLRIWVGLIGIFHGAQKLFGAFNGSGISGFTQFLADKNVPLPTLSAYMAGSAEFFGGILIAVGFFTRFASFLFAFTMAVAIATTFNGAFDNRDGGLEFQALIGIACLTLMFSGPGKYSIQFRQI